MTQPEGDGLNQSGTPRPASATAKVVLNVCTILGVAAGCAAIFVGPDKGIIGGALLPMLGAVAGMAIGKGVIWLLGMGAEEKP